MGPHQDKEGLTLATDPVHHHNSGESKPDPEQLIEALVTANPVMVFSKTYCPYCKKLLEFLAKYDIHPKVLELDILEEEGNAIQNQLKERTGQFTVPSVWVDGIFIGKHLKNPL